MTQDPIEHLLEEHKVIMAEIADLRGAVATLSEQGEAGLEETLPVFNRVGKMMATQLDLHRRKEDDILFPAVEAILGVESSPTGVMREEHQEIHARSVLIRETLHELNEVQHPAIEAGGSRLRELAAGGGSAEALRKTSEEIIDLLDVHFSKEEEILFPMAAELLNQRTLRDVMAGFRELAVEASSGP